MKLTGTKSHEAKISILNDVNGIIKPGRLVIKECYRFFSLVLIKVLKCVLFLLLLQVNTVAWSSWMRKNNFVKGLVRKFRNQSKGSNDENNFVNTLRFFFFAADVRSVYLFLLFFTFCFHSVQVKSLTMDTDWTSLFLRKHRRISVNMICTLQR